GYKWQDAIQTLLVPFWVDFSKDFREEVFKPGQDLPELLRGGNTRTVRQIGKNRPKRAAYTLLCFQQKILLTQPWSSEVEVPFTGVVLVSKVHPVLVSRPSGLREHRGSCSADRHKSPNSVNRCFNAILLTADRGELPEAMPPGCQDERHRTAPSFPPLSTRQQPGDGGCFPTLPLRTAAGP